MGCGDNCLNGIKRLFEYCIKIMVKEGKGEFIFNGLMYNLFLVIYGGRIYKKFVCYIELDFDNE